MNYMKSVVLAPRLERTKLIKILICTDIKKIIIKVLLKKIIINRANKVQFIYLLNLTIYYIIYRRDNKKNF